jgi:oxygen-independent coproporphyrinogen-3 oxidase
VYVHVPFCAKRCFYCSFNTAPLDVDLMARYVRAVQREIGLLGETPWRAGLGLDTVFFGGGTPSLLAPDDLAAAMGALRDRFALASDAEVTVECNPESVTAEKLAAYRASGVTRISLGVQSLDDSILPRLGRLHSARGARAAFDAAREAGFDNVSVDLMYGLPDLTREDWRSAVEAVLAWGPEHLSAYGLTLDAGSAWGATGGPPLPPEETVVEQYWVLAATAAARGYEHYEVSNYARPGRRSRHNLRYWRAAEYLAAGPGACGYVGDVRYANARSTPRYCDLVEAGALPVDSSERLTPAQQRAERLILGLRTSDGVPAAWLAERIAGDSRLEGRREAWEAGGLLAAEGDRIRLTERGFLFSDAVFVDLL